MTTLPVPWWRRGRWRYWGRWDRLPVRAKKSTVSCPASWGSLWISLGNWDDADLAIVVDAVRSGAAPGSLSLTWFGGEAADFQLDRASASVAKAVACGRGQSPSTHGLGVVGVYRLASAMGQAPRRMVVLGIEGQDFSQGEGLSASVAAAIDSAAAIVVDLVRGAGVRQQDLCASSFEPRRHISEKLALLAPATEPASCSANSCANSRPEPAP